MEQKEKGSFHKNRSSRDSGNSRGPSAGDEFKLQERVVKVNRVAKVVKGGRRFSFTAIVVVGDSKGTVGVGYGKAREVSEAIRKGTDDAKKNTFKIPLKGTTVPHEIIGRHGASRVLLKPAPEGFGVRAGLTVRPVVELAGIHNIIGKSLGSNTAINVVAATVDALRKLRDPARVMEIRANA
jgi:small subunit ribosomal protein S5